MSAPEKVESVGWRRLIEGEVERVITDAEYATFMERDREWMHTFGVAFDHLRDALTDAGFMPCPECDAPRNPGDGHTCEGIEPEYDGPYAGDHDTV